MQIRILSKSEKMDSEEDIVIAIFMNSFNAVHTFPALKMEIVLMMRTYYNNNQNMNQEMYFLTCPKKKNYFLILSAFFVTTIAVLSLVFFSGGCFLHQNTLR